MPLGPPIPNLPIDQSQSAPPPTISGMAPDQGPPTTSTPPPTPGPVTPPAPPVPLQSPPVNLGGMPNQTAMRPSLMSILPAILAAGGSLFMNTRKGGPMGLAPSHAQKAVGSALGDFAKGYMDRKLSTINEQRTQQLNEQNWALTTSHTVSDEMDKIDWLALQQVANDQTRRDPIAERARALMSNPQVQEMRNLENQHLLSLAPGAQGGKTPKPLDLGSATKMIALWHSLGGSVNSINEALKAEGGAQAGAAGPIAGTRELTGQAPPGTFSQQIPGVPEQGVPGAIAGQSFLGGMRQPYEYAPGKTAQFTPEDIAKIVTAEHQRILYGNSQAEASRYRTDKDYAYHMARVKDIAMRGGGDAVKARELGTALSNAVRMYQVISANPMMASSPRGQAMASQYQNQISDLMGQLEQLEQGPAQAAPGGPGVGITGPPIVKPAPVQDQNNPKGIVRPPL